MRNGSYRWDDWEEQARRIKNLLHGESEAVQRTAKALMLKRIRKQYYGPSKYDGRGRLKHGKG